MIVVVLFYLGFALLIGWVLFGCNRIDPDSLTHTAILNILSKLGHPEYDGVCHGFTLNWALSVAAGKEKEFYRQLHLLRAHQSDLPATLQRIQKKQVKQSLSKDELLIKDLPQLGKNICIAQDPLEYKKKYGKLVWQSDISTILQTISPNSNVRQIFSKTHTFASRYEANAYFGLLKTMKINDRLAVIISTDDHSMGFKRSGQMWRFININDLFEQQVTRPYFEFTSKQLVDELYRVSVSEPLIKRLTVNTDFIATTSYEPIFKKINKLNNAFPAFPLHSKINNSEKISFFTMAALQGDLATVRKCINEGWSNFFRRQLTENTPLLTAVQQGRRRVVQTMITSIPYRINQRRKSDWATLLHLACTYGGANMVEDLLQIKGILIDPQDKKGRTPLMIACESTEITDEPKLFKLLLDKGASLTIKDNAGLTALDHAKRNRHEIAVDMIQAKLQRKVTPVSRLVKNTGQVTSLKTAFFNTGRKAIVDSGLYRDDNIPGYAAISSTF